MAYANIFGFKFMVMLILNLNYIYLLNKSIEFYISQSFYQAINNYLTNKYIS